MSKNPDNIPTKYYVKQLDRKGNAPNWAVYERALAGTRAVCLCYDEPTAQRIMDLLEEAGREIHGQNGLQT